MKRLIPIVLLAIFSMSYKVMAQEIQISHPEKAEVAKLIAAVEANPDSLNVHKAYIDALGIDNPELPIQYNKWIKEFPKSATVPFAIGNAYKSKERPNAKPFLLQALKINPKYTQAWDGLALDAMRWGDFAASDEYQKMAAESDPSNDMYGYYYVDTFKDKDLMKHKQMVLDFVKKFPASNRCTQAVNKLVARLGTAEEKIEMYEFFKNSFPPVKFGWADRLMTSYFDVLLDGDAQKAADLASEMLKVKGSDQNWPHQLAVAKNLIEIKKLISENKGEEALTLIGNTKFPMYNSNYRINLLLLRVKATSLSKGLQPAYEDLINLFAKTPSLKFKQEISELGMKLGKDKGQIDTDIWSKLDAGAKVATPFTLKRYLTDGTASLSDYLGKVVLLTYWFPGCGPCRGEFPHFENVVKKFKGKGLEYVGINVVPMQNDYVVPFLKGTGYSFTPLEDVVGREKGTLDNRDAAPANFLIDQKGRVIFSDFSINGDNEDQLETMINLLLTK